MDTSSALDVAQHGIQVALMVSMPGLALTLFLGLVVSVFQAVTQVQEMTLTYVPKVIGMAILLTLMGNWMLQKLVAYTTFCLEQASRVG